MADTKVLRCNCKSDFQDKVYGKGMRLHNVMDPRKHKNEAVCTVCGNKKSW